MITGFLKDVFIKQKFILEMSKKDIKSRYLGSFLGVVWAFIQPTVQILIFWFVFQVGFKSAPVDNFPFILWLISAMIPWFFISDSIIGATNSIIDNSYLVKKIVFRVSILPIVRIYSALFIHLFFICFMIIMFAVYGYLPTVYYLQIFYYLFASILLVLGISWITSSLVIFLKDIGQFVGVLVQFGFWLTPIFYSINTVPEKYHFLLKLNPAFYIVEGYRETFIYHKWFWEHPLLSLNFWIITILLLTAGTFIFKKLRPHFADVL
ncbi:ABC transporter permease [Paenibacillus guangzhouensis]|uniref:ABC transporter permease n=1 Tax=Paenibacillus guangzhouensis TaxID=1473112 RepID=UPI001266F33F|nr:ABC transporter permease [Paenibacillus guangzhouensis]